MRARPARRRRTMILPWDNTATPVRGPGSKWPLAQFPKVSRLPAGYFAPGAQRCRFGRSRALRKAGNAPATGSVSLRSGSVCG